ncbi:DJ-1/PfpI family protein [Nocardiopsis trehalosi]|jgi:putative intracellular protease/amidase|uniref:DJ-1/PfpI family protein n=1 Tax=Nocardiopsis trehalosi TaxID=109329 RepID=UPI000833873A|nr:DJ-1/PfpI family protein [Nocardiopsis trehalosi]
MLIQIALFDGFDPLDVIAPFEMFDAAGGLTGGAVRVELASAEGPREVPSGVPPLSLAAVAALDPARADVLVVPGAAGRPAPDGPGGAGADGAEGAEGAGGADIATLLRRAADSDLAVRAAEALERPDTLVATVCGGALLLGMAGLLKGRHATTHHLGMAALAETGVDAVPARVVDDGDLVSAAGVTSGLDLALHLIDREVGPRVAHAVEQVFTHERRGIVWRPRGPVPAL